jgi:glycosyltransferase involved in cell wall biosynthesis
MPKVLEKFPECHFVFAGGLAKGGEENLAACKDYCEKANISRNVHFLGERTDVPEILKALDLFVFSSFQEGMPIAVIEAMLAGLPILLSDIEPLREVAGEGNLDFFGPGDESDLANKMIALLGDADLRNSMAFRSHAFAIESYSIEANLNKLAKVYGDLR